jgi:hypothetical protein
MSRPPAFAQEALFRLWRSETVAEHLQRHSASVLKLFRLVDGAHPSRS